MLAKVVAPQVLEFVRDGCRDRSDAHQAGRFVGDARVHEEDGVAYLRVVIHYGCCVVSAGVSSTPRVLFVSHSFAVAEA
eukprot:9416153-Pyramimonas_sp.AAC.1